MIIVMKKESKIKEINAVIKTLHKSESYISKVYGKSVIVVK